METTIRMIIYCKQQKEFIVSTISHVTEKKISKSRRLFKKKQRSVHFCL